MIGTDRGLIPASSRAAGPRERYWHQESAEAPRSPSRFRLLRTVFVFFNQARTPAVARAEISAVLALSRGPASGAHFRLFFSASLLTAPDHEVMTSFIR